jgi:hypothetical protein
MSSAVVRPEAAGIRIDRQELRYLERRRAIIIGEDRNAASEGC